MDALLRLEQVSFVYEEGGGEPALKNCSLTIDAGERVAVLGSNGAGKSTFFLLSNGVLRPQSGTVYFQGRPVGGSARELSALRRGVGLVFQDPDVQLLGGTVEEEISFGPMNLGLPRDEVRRRVDEAVVSLALEPLRRRAPQYLSGGEKKRVTIADVLAMEPRLLLLDEPAASLDPMNAGLLEENLAMLERRGIALAVATHDVNFAWRWARRVLVFSQGELAADAPPEEIFADEALLNRCHLEPPLLFRAGRALGLSPLPRTIEDLENAVRVGRIEKERAPMKQALLCVSFGTSVIAAQESITAVEETLAGLTPERTFVRAFTSPTIRRILEKRGQRVESLEEALEALCAAGYTDVLVQPTHLLPGIEFDKIQEAVRARLPQFERLRLGQPLFNGEAAVSTVTKLLDAAYPAQDGEALVLLGHGTEHPSNAVDPALQEAFAAAGRKDVYIATVEGSPTYEQVASKLGADGIRRVHLAPLMLVAGDHAKNDMAGAAPESWKSRLEATGCVVRCTMTGLGLLPGIQTLYGERLSEALME